MKILHIHVNEFHADTNLGLVLEKEVGNNHRLLSCTKSAITALRDRVDAKTRIFHWTLTPFNDIPYIQLYETIWD
jgi:hypothetical protein